MFLINQLVRKVPTPKIETKTFKELKALKDNKFIDLSDLPATRLYGQAVCVLLFYIVALYYTIFKNI